MAFADAQDHERRVVQNVFVPRRIHENADYEAQLAQKCYEEVDPSNRLVAATLERRWNDTLVETEQVREQFAEFEKKHARVATAEQKAEVLALAEDFPRVWNAPTTQLKDRKRMLRFLQSPLRKGRVVQPPE